MLESAGIGQKSLPEADLDRLLQYEVLLRAGLHKSRRREMFRGARVA